MAEEHFGANRSFLSLKSQIDDELHSLSVSLEQVPADDLSDELYLKFSRRMDYIQNLFDSVSEVSRELTLNQSNPELYDVLQAKSDLNDSYGAFHRTRSAFFSRFSKNRDGRDEELTRERVFSSSEERFDESIPEEDMPTEDLDNEDELLLEEELARLEEEEAEAKKEARSARQKRLVEQNRRQDARNAEQRARWDSENQQQTRQAEASRLSMESVPGQSFSEADLRNERLRQDDERLRAEQENDRRRQHEKEVFERYRRNVEESENFERLSRSHNDLSRDGVGRSGRQTEQSQGDSGESPSQVSESAQVARDPSFPSDETHVYDRTELGGDSAVRSRSDVPPVSSEQNRSPRSNTSEEPVQNEHYRHAEGYHDTERPRSEPHDVKTPPISQAEPVNQGNVQKDELNRVDPYESERQRSEAYRQKADAYDVETPPVSRSEPFNLRENQRADSTPDGSYGATRTGNQEVEPTFTNRPGSGELRNSQRDDFVRPAPHPNRSEYQNIRNRETDASPQLGPYGADSWQQGPTQDTRSFEPLKSQREPVSHDSQPVPPIDVSIQKESSHREILDRGGTAGPSQAFAPYQFVPGGIQQVSKATGQVPFGTVDVGNNAKIYASLLENKKEPVPLAYETQMRFNMERARLNYVEHRETAQAAEAAHTYLEQRNAYVSYCSAVKNGTLSRAEPKVHSVDLSRKPSPVNTKVPGVVYSYTPSGVSGVAVENGRRTGSSTHFENPGVKINRIISPRNPLYVSPEYEMAISTRMHQAVQTMNQVMSGDGKSRTLSPETAAHVKFYTDAYLGFRQAKMDGSVVVVPDSKSNPAPKGNHNQTVRPSQTGQFDHDVLRGTPDFRFWQERRQVHKTVGTTAQTKGINPNKTSKAEVETAVANIFNSSSKLKPDALYKRYFRQAASRAGDYSAMATTMLSRRFYRLMQEGDDNPVRTMETGRYYAVSAVGIGLAIRDRGVVRANMSGSLHAPNLEFKRYGVTSLLSQKDLSRQINNGIRVSRENMAERAVLAKQLEHFNQLEEKGAMNSLLRVKQAQTKARFDQLVKEHASLSGELRKHQSLQKFRFQDRVHNDLVKELGQYGRKTGEPPKNLKQLDRAMRDINAKSQQTMQKKFGGLTRMSEKSLAKEINRLKQQGNELAAQIKKLQMKGSALSQAERKLLMDLMADKKKLGAQISQMVGLKNAREVLNMKMSELGAYRHKLSLGKHRIYGGLFALQSFLLRPITSGDEVGAQGLAKLAQISSNRYVHILLRQSFRGTIFLGKTAMELVLPGSSQALSNSMFLAKESVKASVHAGTTAVKTAVKTGVRTAANAAKRGVIHITPERIKTAARTTVRASRVVKSRYDTVATGIKNTVFKAQQWLANTKLGRGVAWTRRFSSNVSQALKLAGGVLKKVALRSLIVYFGGFFLMSMIATAATAIMGASSSSLILAPEESVDNKINLAPYVEILAGYQDSFDSEIVALQNDSKYDNVYIDYKTGLTDNMKEMLSMMAVRLSQDLDIEKNPKVEEYLSSIFWDSHTYHTTERNYKCGGCETEQITVTTTDENGNEVTETKTITVCNGHTDLSIDIYVYGFDELFMLDSMGNSDASFVGGKQIGRFTITYYCACTICCGENATGKTATGTTPKANHTIAVDPNVIPLGSTVMIDGKKYVAEDTGSAIKGKRIDIYMASHQAALSAGKRTNVPVYSAEVTGTNYQDSGVWDGWTEGNIEWCKLIYNMDWSEIYELGDLGGTIVGRPDSGDLVVEGDYVWPVTSTTNSSGFGWRIHPITGQRSFHNGTDIPVPTGTQVHAAADGVVSGSGYNSSMGNYVWIDHANGVQTRYYHNSRLMVKVGDKVTAGQVISLSGNTGASTGPHLHFEFRVNGTPIDPRDQYGL